MHYFDLLAQNVTIRCTFTFWDKVFYIDITIGKENYYETDNQRNYVLAAFGWGSCDHFDRIDHYLRYYFFCEETQRQKE